MANAMFVDTDSTIWIGTGRKLVHFDPRTDKINTIAPALLIREIRMFHVPVNWQAMRDSGFVKFDSIDTFSGMPIGLIMQHDRNHLIIDIAAVNQKNPESTTIRYYLHGFDKSWSPPATSGTATYPSLPPGDYILYAKATNEDGFESPGTELMRFTITPPWWETTYARIMFGIFAVGLIWLIIRIRERKLLRDKQILEDKVRMRTAEVVRQKEEILQKNSVLQQQKEEIQAQRDEIEAQRDNAVEQRDIITHQKEELTSSINYALRIQQAALPARENLDEWLGDYFLLFRPRDIVSGDFYWVWKYENLLFLCVADCTGHGVPGAFMSMLGMAGLHEVVRNRRETNPGAIVDGLRQYVIKSLRQHKHTPTNLPGSKLPNPTAANDFSTTVKDGMDLSVCVIDLTTHILHFTGANNPCWLVPTSGTGLVELKPDKMPVAIHERMDPFTTQEYQLATGDCLYLMSDGYEDQFGGPFGKKFKSKKMKDLLAGIANRSMTEQSEHMNHTLDQWMTYEEQVDDVTLLGVRIP